MNMDSSPRNWLGFSLSNHANSLSHSSELCLFEAFNHHVNPVTTVVGATPDENTADGGATGFSTFNSTGPKLEDFLGGSSTSAPQQTLAAPTQLQSQLLCHYSTEATATTVSAAPAIYDSELKTIATSFLRDFANSGKDLTGTEKQQHRLLVNAEPTSNKTVDTFGQRTSIFRGVTRHRWTGRYEAHLWDNSCRREGQSRKGRQVYLGGYDKEEKAARAYDLAALKYWGPATTTNFPVLNYEKELEEMKHMSRQEFVASLRRRSSGFSRGASIYRGVTRHHQHGRWQARIGRVAGNKDLYLGTFSTQEEAAEAYDIAAIKFRGLNAVTNFDMSRYDVKSIANSNFPVGGASGKSKNSSGSAASDSKTINGSRSDDLDLSSASSSVVTFASQPATSTLSFALPVKQDTSGYWSMLGYPNTTSTALNSANDSTSSASAPTTLFQSSITNSAFQSPAAFSMYFNATSSVSESDNKWLQLDGGFVLQQSGGTTNTAPSPNLPFATPISLHSYATTSYDTNSGYGSWNIVPYSHSLQSAKANLSVFQTPIFGME